MTNLNKISFADGITIKIDEIPSYTDFRGKFVEQIDYDLCKIIDKFEDLHPATKTLFKTTVMENIKPNGDLVVKHSQRHKIGRFYADGDISLIPHARVIKHTLMHYGGWVDIDQCKGHSTIAVELFKDVLPLPNIKHYINNFDDVVNKLIMYHSTEGNPLNAGDIKYLFNMLIYGGSFNTWVKCITANDVAKGYVGKNILNENSPHDFVLNYIEECKTMTNLIVINNPELVKLVKKETKWKTESSATSYFFQIIENHILYITYQFLVGKNIIKPRYCGLEYDGLCFKPNCDFDKDLIIEELNKYILELTGLKITYKFKGYESTALHHLICERNTTTTEEQKKEQKKLIEKEEKEHKKQIEKEEKEHKKQIEKEEKEHKKKIEKDRKETEVELNKSKKFEQNNEKLVGNILDGDDKGASEVIMEKYPYWKCCLGQLYVFDDTTGMWSDDINIQNRIISSLSDYLNIVINTINGAEFTGKNYGRCNYKRRDIYAFIKESCVDDDWLMRTQSTSLGKILFKNGHHDFKESVFRYGFKQGGEPEGEINGFNPEIVFMYRIDHNYTHFDDSDMVYMESIKEKLFTKPLGEDVGNYWILNIARGLAGDVMKKIMFGLGSGDTGKGVFTKACMSSMGQYCSPFLAESLAYNNNNVDESAKLRWVFLLQHKRVVISNEITSNKPLNSNLIRKICSGGDKLQGRVHGGLETDFTPQFLAIVMANDLPPIKPYDKPTQNRVNVIGYKLPYVDEPTNEFELKKDYDIEKEIETLQFRRCFIGMLIRQYLEFQDGGRIEIVPDGVLKAKDDWFGSDEENSIMVKFQQKYEITNNIDDFVKSSEIENWTVNEKESSYKKFCQELKKYCVVNGFNNVDTRDKKINKKVSKHWFGLKLIDDECDENHCVIGGGYLLEEV